MTNVSIIDYGIGNVRSVYNAVLRTGAPVQIASDGPSLVAQNPDRILLPGVGAVGQALDNVRSRRFVPVLEELVLQRRIPFCGICVGMQMLAETCEEFGHHQGLGWVPGHVGRLETNDDKFSLPHMGWNTIVAKDPNDPLIGALDGHDMYFAHSYTFKCPEDYVLSTTDYGGAFTSAVKRDHIVGVQFHPEKSSQLGGAFLRAFISGHGEGEEVGDV